MKKLLSAIAFLIVFTISANAGNVIVVPGQRTVSQFGEWFYIITCPPPNTDNCLSLAQNDDGTWTLILNSPGPNPFGQQNIPLESYTLTEDDDGRIESVTVQVK